MSLLYLLTISGPAGVGKTTLAKILESELHYAVRIPLYTTRPCRPGELEGIDYRFVSINEFNSLDQKGEFLIRHKCRAYNYGFRKISIYESCNKYSLALVDVPWAVAIYLQQIYPRWISLYLLPPSEEERLARLQDRNRAQLSKFDYKPASDEAKLLFPLKIVTYSIERTVYDALCILRDIL